MKILPTWFIGSRIDRFLLGFGIVGLWVGPFIFGFMAYEASPIGMKVVFSVVSGALLLLAYTLSVTLRGVKFVLTGKDY